MKKITLLLALGCAVQWGTTERAQAPDQDQKKDWDEKHGKERKEKKQQENPSIVQTGPTPNSVAFSPDGTIAAVANAGNHNVSVYRVDRQSGVFTPVQGSPFAAGTFPSSVAFSPDGTIAAVANKGSDNVYIYEVYQKTGEFKPITGNLLNMEQRRQEAKKAHEALVETGILLKDPFDIISQYIGTQPVRAERKVKTEEDIAQDIKKGYEEEDPVIAQEIAKAKGQCDKREFNRESLFIAIKAGDMKKLQENITPFSINGISDSNTKSTPLMQSAKLGRDEMVNALLNYQGTIRSTKYLVETVHANLGAVDTNGDTALMIAIQEKNFASARMIAQKMKSQELDIKNKKNQDAYDLANKYKYDQEKNPNYQELMKILSAAHKEQEAIKKMEEVD